MLRGLVGVEALCGLRSFSSHMPFRAIKTRRRSPARSPLGESGGRGASGAGGGFVICGISSETGAAAEAGPREEATQDTALERKAAVEDAGGDGNTAGIVGSVGNEVGQEHAGAPARNPSEQRVDG